MKLFLARLFGAGRIAVNGQEHRGSLVEVRVYVDGKPATSVQLTQKLEIRIEGNVQTLESASGDVAVMGNAERVKTASGDVSCGDVTGSVSTVSGDVQCGIVHGDVTSISGDIEMKTR